MSGVTPPPPPPPLSSRNRAAKGLSIVSPIVVAALYGFAWIAPPNWPAWRMFGWVTVLLWLAWVIWAWPRVDIDSEKLTVRNALRTFRIPLREIASVDGGRNCTLSLTDGSRIIVAAVSGDGITLEAWRRTDAATEGGHFIRRADDARISAGEPSVATRWATLLRHRIIAAPESARGEIVMQVNWPIIAVSAGIVILLIATITALR